MAATASPTDGEALLIRIDMVVVKGVKPITHRLFLITSIAIFFPRRYMFKMLIS